MRILKKIAWLAVPILILALLSLSFAKNGQAATSIVNFSAGELQTIKPDGSTFVFKSKTVIVGNIKHNGIVHQVTFTSGATNPRVGGNSPWPYNQDGSFCVPANSVLNPNTISIYTSPSILYVRLTSTNPLRGEIVNNGNLSTSHLWPGPDGIVKNHVSHCGINTHIQSPSGDFYAMPVPITQNEVVYNGPPTGTGSKYTKSVVASATYTLTSSGIIQMKFHVAPDPKDPIPSPINLVDIKPYDNIFQYVSPNLFCDGNGDGNAMKITLDSSLAKGTILANLDQASFFNGNTCLTDKTKWPQKTISVSNPSDKLTDKSTARRVQEIAEWDVDSSGQPAIDLFTCQVGGNCTNGTQLTYIKSLKAYTENDSGNPGITIKLASGSDYLGSLSNLSNGGVRSSIAILGTKGQSVKPPPSPSGNPTTGTGVDCETQAATGNIAGKELAFFACPMLNAAQSFSDWLIGEVESMLTFTFQNNLGSSKVDPNTGRSQRGNVQDAWSSIRDLASVVLVIIMLVMVLSQAIGGGPFDAYTVRKVLPRLVIAVLLMQLSWSLLRWVVRDFDDLGHGIADLIYQPFGGPDKLQLGPILQQAGIQAYAGGSVVLASLIGIAVIAVLSLPTILLIGWSIVLALMVAWVTLAVRQIFLIAAIIFAPLAFLLWILPGTQKFWKVWYDNFTKLLLVFPMIIGLIAIGRVFALITSSGTDSKLVKFVLILIGYFGPFFFIPKTLKWGGQLMGAANNAISGAAPKLGGPVTNFLKGQQERSRWTLSRQRRKEQLMRRAQAGWSEGMTRGGIRGRINRSRGAGLRSIGLPGRASGLTPWVRGDRQVRQRIAYGAESASEKLRTEEAQEELTHLMSRDRFRRGDWGEITDMAQRDEEHFRRVAMGRMINSRRGHELRTVFNSDPARYMDDVRHLLSTDEAGRVRGALEEMGLPLPPGTITPPPTTP